MKSLGAVGDEDISFKELKSNSDIEDLFEHVSLAIRVTRDSCTATVNGSGALFNCSHEEVDIPLSSAFGVRTETTPFSVGVFRVPQEDNTVHRGVSCDMCGMNPIIGKRYKSSSKLDNYDLCQGCVDKLGPSGAAKIL